MDTLDPRETPLPGTRPPFNAWNFRADAGWSTQFDLVGYHVEATDGGIGKVTEASHALEESYLVVDTGPWIFGKKVMIPAGLIREIDPDTETVFVARSKDEIKSAPEFDEERYHQQSYRDELGTHYGAGPTSTGPGQGI